MDSPKSDSSHELDLPGPTVSNRSPGDADEEEQDESGGFSENLSNASSSNIQSGSTEVSEEARKAYKEYVKSRKELEEEEREKMQ